jgi:hypothetical protein
MLGLLLPSDVRHQGQMLEDPELEAKTQRFHTGSGAGIATFCLIGYISRVPNDYEICSGNNLEKE